MSRLSSTDYPDDNDIVRANGRMLTSAELAPRTGVLEMERLPGKNRLTGRGIRNGVPRSKPYRYSKKYLCPVCGKIDRDPGMIQVHLLIHGREAWHAAAAT